MDFLAARKALLAKPERVQRWIFFSGLGVTFAFTLVVLFAANWFSFLNYRVYDSYLRSAPVAPRPVQRRPVIVDVDEESLAQFGQWPWPRHRVAQLLDSISKMNPSSIGVDILFSEPDRTSLVNVQHAFMREYGVTIRFTEIPERFLDNDVILAKTLMQGPYVLAFGFVFGTPSETKLGCPGSAVSLYRGPQRGESEGIDRFYRPSAAICSLDTLTQAAPSSGFINIAPDEDGVLRRVPVVIPFQGKLYANLALQAVAKAQHTEEVRVRFRQGLMTHILIGGSSIPLDEKGNTLINPGALRQPFDRIRASDILGGRVQEDLLAGRVVLVGTTAMGLEAYHTTSLGNMVPGVAIHAALIENILNNQLYAVPEWGRTLELLLVILLGVVSSLLVSWAQSFVGFILIGAVAGALWQGSLLLLSSAGLYVSPVLPVMTLAVNSILLIFLKYLKEEKKLRQRNRELVTMQNFTIQCLAALAETRDSETGRHIVRCQHYVKLLAQKMAKLPHLRRIFSEETVDLLCKSAPLHDIGKIGVPDRVLLKPGRLTVYEFEEMKRHTTYGQAAIERAERFYGAEVKESFLRFGKEMAYSHHERWDGMGYPEGVKEEEIPLSGRIMAIADVYDALINKRRYKPSFSHEEAVVMISKGRGTHFDPVVVDIFMQCHEEFRAVAIEFSDEDDPVLS